MPNQKPDILFVVVDSARYDRMGDPNALPRHAPFLARLREQATNYTNAFAPGGSTRIAMSSIFTGLYPSAYGFADERFPGDEHAYLAERLQRAGYYTCMYSNNPWVSPASGLNRGFDRVCYLNRANSLRQLKPASLMRLAWPLLRGKLSSRLTLKVLSDAMIELAVDDLRTHTTDDRPLLTYVHLDAHHPYLSERKYLGRFLPPHMSETTIRQAERYQRDYRDMLYFLTPEIDEQTREQYFAALMAMYEASIAKADDQIKRLLDAHAAHRRGRQSVAVITSDHGEMIGEKRMMRHGQFPYELALHVPLMVKFPPGVGTPGDSGRLTSTIDIFPTLCDLAGADKPDALQGISMLQADGHPFVINERRQQYEKLEQFQKRYPTLDLTEARLGHIIALRDLKMKYIWTSEGGQYLYDVVCDPDESTNLAESRPDDTQRYDELMQNWRAGLDVRAGRVDEFTDEGVLTHLRDLGYIA